MSFRSSELLQRTELVRFQLDDVIGFLVITKINQKTVINLR